MAGKKVKLQAGLGRGLVLSLASGVFLAAAAPAAATSNMGFKQSVLLNSTPGAQLYWLSLPYVYSPADVGTPGTLDAEDLCQDLGSPGVVAVLRWDEPSSTFLQHVCGGGSPFPLVQGIGYAISVAPSRGVASTVSGSHDEGFSYSIPPTTGGQLTWLSVPPHVRIPENGGGSRVTAEDLCRQIGSEDVFAIVRWNGTTGAYQAYGCGSQLEPPFEIVRGQSYGVINRPGATIEWQPIHY